MKNHLLFPALALALAMLPAARADNADLLTREWSARWIYVPNSPSFDYGVYHFRRAFELPSKPASFLVHVSGDNRYQLFVNGERVVSGPARGDIYHWRYETVDIARQLKAGRNVLAAVVWNFGEQAPLAQITYRTGFLLQGDTQAERLADTGPLWKCARDQAYAPIPFAGESHSFYYVAGPGDRVDGAKYPWGWERPDFDDSGWVKPGLEDRAAPRAARDAHSRWMLVPRPIPLEEEKAERIGAVRKAEGVTIPAGFPKKAASIQVPANTRAKVLLDQEWLTTGYPELIVSGGKGATVTLSYAESLWVPKTSNQKGNRNEVEGKEFHGYRDVFVADGGANRMFRPLWWRTWRYIELTLETKNAPLTVQDLRGVFTGYPFERRARFDAGSEELQKILDVGWRTARLCAHDSYMDCPYYEQLQYAGDTRVQSLVSLYMSGDARLMKNAIEQLDSSRTAEGATYSRAPSRLQQYIPGFSLWWIGMVRDYWMYQNDPAFVKQMLPGVRAVLSFFASHQKAGGSLGKMPWWNYVDWVDGFPNGVPPAGPDGSSAPQDLQLLLAYEWAANMEDALGSKAMAQEYRRAETELRDAVKRMYWDPARNMFADTPQKKNFSQHANVLAILTGTIEGPEARALFDRIRGDKSLAKCSIYFRHYLHEAANRVGSGDLYLDMLDEWRGMLARGLTTWSEVSDPTRSDCHAWGSSPNFELFRTVLGIDSAAPGFRRVVIRPFLGKLTKVSGAIPHPNGEVAVNLQLSGGKLQAEVTLPKGVEGEFVWKGTSRPLPAGTSKLVF